MPAPIEGLNQRGRSVLPSDITGRFLSVAFPGPEILRFPLNAHVEQEPSEPPLAELAEQRDDRVDALLPVEQLTSTWRCRSGSWSLRRRL